jgi:hypothetical protein
MSVKVRWIFASILCLCTLVALWVTAARVKDRKMAARYGDRIPPSVVDSSKPSTVRLRPGKQTPAGHFLLEFLDEMKIRVLDADGRPLVDFPGVRKGLVRRWQELQLTVVDVASEPPSVSLEVEFKPGSPCFGSGIFHQLRAGLQVQFDAGRTVSIVGWDPAKPEMTLKFEGRGEPVQRTFGRSGEGRELSIRYQLLESLILADAE